MIRLEVHVRPAARRDAVGGNYAGALLVITRARAIDGAANDAVITALETAFGVAPGAVQCLRGHRSRRKFVEIAGDEVALRVRLADLLGHTDPRVVSGTA